MAQPADYAKARRHLGRRDPTLKRLMADIGPCSLCPNPDGFVMLSRSIVAQQISSKAAQSISGRLLTLLGDDGLTPAALLKHTDDELRSVGLSAGKTKSLRDLAEKVQSGAVPLERFATMDDEAVVEALLPVRGIGRWTAQMFLIFSLGRLDVLPVDDFGLKAGVRDLYGLADLPGKAELTQRAEPWRPYATIATWYFWRSRDAAKPAK